MKDNEKLKKAKEKSKGFIGEFKAFVLRGNVMDMAIGVIIGGAFATIVTALTDDFINPIINFLNIFHKICFHIILYFLACKCIDIIFQFIR